MKKQKHQKTKDTSQKNPIKNLTEEKEAPTSSVKLPKKKPFQSKNEFLCEFQIMRNHGRDILIPFNYFTDFGNGVEKTKNTIDFLKRHLGKRVKVTVEILHEEDKVD